MRRGRNTNRENIFPGFNQRGHIECPAVERSFDLAKQRSVKPYRCSVVDALKSKLDMARLSACRSL